MIFALYDRMPVRGYGEMSQMVRFIDVKERESGRLLNFQ